MKEVQDFTTEEELDAALERAKLAPSRPVALSAEYNRDLDLVLIRLDNGRRLAIPREDLQGLQNATPEQLSDIEIFAGVNIGWRQLDVDHYLPHLIERTYSSERWKQARQRQFVAA